MGMVSEAGKAIAVAVAAIGIALGMTVGTIAAGVGAGAVTRVSVALIGGAVFVIAVNAAARRRIGKASAR
ncbi:hypothetical protein ACFPPD_11060 [Cohnella suwonensis]|uniref:Uncharacterized protein n=1 Tax=Cohnella suwonensis TaxID=696072 RepID=A0ABW0LTL1_9BACL